MMKKDGIIFFCVFCILNIFYILYAMYIDSERSVFQSYYEAWGRPVVILLPLLITFIIKTTYFKTYKYTYGLIAKLLVLYLVFCGLVFLMVLAIGVYILLSSGAI